MLTVRITGAQLRAARRALNWSVQELGRRSRTNWFTVRKYEAAGSYLPPASVAAMNRIVDAIEAAGIEFHSDGSVGMVEKPRHRESRTGGGCTMMPVAATNHVLDSIDGLEIDRTHANIVDPAAEQRARRKLHGCRA